jgi:hypothetical protein
MLGNYQVSKELVISRVVLSSRELIIYGLMWTGLVWLRIGTGGELL